MATTAIERKHTDGPDGGQLLEPAVNGGDRRSDQFHRGETDPILQRCRSSELTRHRQFLEMLPATKGDDSMIQFNAYKENRRAPMVGIAKAGGSYRQDTGLILVTLIDNERFPTARIHLCGNHGSGLTHRK